MRIVSMIEDFKEFHKDTQQLGKWEAFLKYYENYKELFDVMLKGLYRIEFEDFKGIVEQTNFDDILKEIEAIDLSIMDDIKGRVSKSVYDLDFNEEFDIYIGVGLGHVGGTALPTERPSIYFGLECLKRCDLNYLIPHEVNHMVRVHAIKDINLDSFLERVITEGLGVITPIVINNLPIDRDTLSKTLIISPKQAELLLEHEDELIKEVIKHFGDRLDYELSNAFFTGNSLDESKPILSGYYVGLRIIEKALIEGISFNELTRLAAEDFIRYIPQY